MPNGSYILFYDGSCGLCRRAVRAIVWMNPRQPMAYVDIHDGRRMAKYPQIDRARAMASVTLLGPGGRIWRGFDAVTEVVATLPVVGWLSHVMRLAPVRAVGRWIYERVSAHRHGISRVLGIASWPDS